MPVWGLLTSSAALTRGFIRCAMHAMHVMREDNNHDETTRKRTAYDVLADVQDHLDAALEADEPANARRHLREAMQLCIAARAFGAPADHPADAHGDVATDGGRDVGDEEDADTWVTVAEMTDDDDDNGTDAAGPLADAGEEIRREDPETGRQVPRVDDVPELAVWDENGKRGRRTKFVEGFTSGTAWLSADADAVINLREGQGR